MVLGFKKQFVDKILSGSKIHTIREDPKNRWKWPNVIHFATGVRTKNYHQFKEGQCKSVQEIQMFWYRRDFETIFRVYIDGKSFGTIVINKGHEDNPIITGDLEALALNDGFDSLEEFMKWFKDDFKGKLIHWTDKKY